MLILNLDGDLLNGLFYGSGPTYYFNIQHYMDHFYFQNTQINPDEEAYNSIVVMNQNLNTVAAFLAEELYLYDNTSGVDLNRTDGEILFALNQNTGYSFSVLDMAENECLQPYVASDLFMTISDINNLNQHFISGLVTKNNIPIENNSLETLPVENSNELTYSIGCAENTNLSTETLELQINIFPNPTQDVLYLSDPEIFAKVHFVDFLGRVVKSIHTPTNEILTNDLQSGYYVIQFHLKNGSLHSEKITILR
jgi:hypothetical protein